MYRNKSKREQREMESMKLAAAKQYALMRYFNKIERFLRQSRIETIGFKIVSLTEASDWAHLVIMTTQYRNRQRVEVPYFVDVKTRLVDDKKKYYFRLDEIEHDSYKCHVDVYDIENPVGQTGATR